MSRDKLGIWEDESFYCGGLDYFFILCLVSIFDKNIGYLSKR